MSATFTAYLSLGSNLGDRHQNIVDALTQLEDKAGIVTRVSKIYQNPPKGFEADNDFLNLCAEVKTQLSAHHLLDTIQKIESDLGRSKNTSKTYASRPIDIDIILFGEHVLKSENLTIPHPHFRKRMFVLKPLNDIAKDEIDPETMLTIEQLFNNCSDQSIMRIYNQSKF